MHTRVAVEGTAAMQFPRLPGTIRLNRCCNLSSCTTCHFVMQGRKKRDQANSSNSKSQPLPFAPADLPNLCGPTHPVLPTIRHRHPTPPHQPRSLPEPRAHIQLHTTQPQLQPCAFTPPKTLPQRSMGAHIMHKKRLPSIGSEVDAPDAGSAQLDVR